MSKLEGIVHELNRIAADLKVAGYDEDWVRLADWISSIKTPPGFKREEGEGQHEKNSVRKLVRPSPPDQPFMWVRFEAPDVVIVIRTYSWTPRRSGDSGLHGEAEVFAKMPNGKWRSVDGLGGSAALGHHPDRINDSIEKYVKLAREEWAAGTEDDLREFMRSIRTPAGFKREEGEGSRSPWGEIWGKWEEEHHRGFPQFNGWVRLYNDQVDITVNCSTRSSSDWGHTKDNLIEVSGHTNFNTPNGWRTFSRRGIDDSFYGGDKNINRIVKEQIKRAEDRARDYQGATDVTIQGRKFTLTPTMLEEAKRRLQTSGRYMLTPGGMGVAYVLTRHRPQGRYGVGEVPRDVAELLGQSRLYYEQVDYD